MTFHPVGQTIGNLTPPLTVANGGTGATSAGAALTSLGAASAADAGPGPVDQGLLAWNYDPVGAPGGSTVLATGGTMYVMAVPVKVPISVTNIVAVLLTNGSVLTSGQCFGALYAGAGGSLIGQTADQSVAWGAGATKSLTMALASGPFNVAVGTAYVAFWFNGTTGPAFTRSATTSQQINLGLAATASRWGTANTGVTTTAPGTLGTIAAAGNAYWVGLS